MPVLMSEEIIKREIGIYIIRPKLQSQKAPSLTLISSATALHRSSVSRKLQQSMPMMSIRVTTNRDAFKKAYNPVTIDRQS